MKSIRVILIIMLANLAIMTIKAQSLWTSADFNYGLTRQWSLGAVAEYRTTGSLKDTDRWTIGANANYKPFKFMKFDAGYKYINQLAETEITRKGNIIPSYRYDRHRAYVSATGKLKLGRFGLSLRERYQMTKRVGRWVPKYASDGVSPKADEWISNKYKHVMRSRLECDYNIKKSRFSPSVSIEMYDNLGENFSVEKVRYTVGCACKIDKLNSFDLYYRYIQIPTSEIKTNRGQHIIGIGYNLNL